MAKFAKTKKAGALVLSQQMVEQQVTHPEWFHVFSQDGQVQIAVNIFRLPAPERSMVADWAGASLLGTTTVVLVFGQRPPERKKLTGALIVQMPKEKVKLAMIENADFVAAVDKYAADHGIVPAAHLPEPMNYPEERIVTERAQILSIVLGGDDAELRFHWTSQTDIHTIMQHQKVDLVRPLIEVRMPAEELVHLMRTVTDLIGGTP
jgi:hypothetical protein